MFSRSSATQAAGAKKESIKKNEQVLHHRHKFSGQTLSSQAEVLPFLQNHTIPVVWPRHEGDADGGKYLLAWWQLVEGRLMQQGR